MASITDCVVEGLKYPFNDIKKLLGLGVLFALISALSTFISTQSFEVSTITMNFVENANNPEFRDNIISFDIVCHFDQWQLEDFELRPYRIAAEIDSMFNDKHLTGIGSLQFLGANQIVINNEFAGLTLMYSAIHGGEDKVGMPNPANNAQFEQDFDKLFNN